MRRMSINPVRDKKFYSIKPSSLLISNGVKRICCILVILSLYTSLSFASSHSSSNYILFMPRMVASGGSSSSSNYSIEDAAIGEVFGGAAKSANYSLDVTNINKTIAQIPPASPTLNPVKSPTNKAGQTLSGTKEKGTSICINGYEKVPLDNNINWSCDVTLTEGENHFIITARNKPGLESESVNLTITLDTIPPLIIINSPLDGTIVYSGLIEGTIDGTPFTEEKELIFGLNSVPIEATDEAGNKSTESIEVYLIREPLVPPQT